MFDINMKHDESTFKQFVDYCEKRACDGCWGYDEAMMCVKIVRDINSIEVRFLGILCKKKTERAREAAWKLVRFALHTTAALFNDLENRQNEMKKEYDYEFNQINYQFEKMNEKLNG